MTAITPITESRSTTTPDKLRRPLSKLLVIGATGLAAMGVYKGAVQPISGHIQETNLSTDIKASGEQAVADYNDGLFDPSEVSKVQLDKSQSVSAAAANMAEAGDILPVQDLLSEQVQGQIDGGTEVVLPNSLIKKKYESTPASTVVQPELITPFEPSTPVHLPEDRNIHVK